MTQQEIEARIKTLENMLVAERNVSTIATINRCIEKLIMMEPKHSEEKVK